MTARITIDPTALILLLSAILLVATPALADESDPEGCCICDCSERATTSGGAPPRVPDGAICIDASSTVCGSVCDLEGCLVDGFEPTECSAIPGCAQSGGVMAPAASPLTLTGIAAALVMLGVAAVRRRGRRDFGR